MKGLVFTAACVAAFSVSVASAQEFKVAEAKLKGALALKVEDLKSLLPGAVVKYETLSTLTELTLRPDGSITGNTQATTGRFAGRVNGITGSWSISENGRWCGKTLSTAVGAQELSWCRVVWKMGDQYLWSNGISDSAMSYVMSVKR